MLVAKIKHVNTSIFPGISCFHQKQELLILRTPEDLFVFVKNKGLSVPPYAHFNDSFP